MELTVRQSSDNERRETEFTDGPAAQEFSQPAATDDRAGAEAGAGHGVGRPGGFEVHLAVFEGPFDLLLGLIAKHKLDVTEVALSKVTDEFIAYIRGHGPEWDLGQATEFLVVAATLLDLKAAKLLPSAEVEDEEDLALLEARDLLFARLLQYRAYKQVAAIFAGRMADEAKRFPRAVGLEPHFANLLPEVLLGLGPQEFARLAARALTPKPPPTVSVSHLHEPRVSVREQAAVLVERLRRVKSATFRALTADCEGTLAVVARFLALLELFKEGAVAFEQVTPMGELHIRWTGSESGELAVTDEFDADDPVVAAGRKAGTEGAYAELGSEPDAPSGLQSDSPAEVQPDSQSGAQPGTEPDVQPGTQPGPEPEVRSEGEAETPAARSPETRDESMPETQEEDEH